MRPAEALLKRPHASDDLVECALSSCFNNTECFHNYDHELAQNPASHRVFNLTLCAFVSTDYPLECDHRNCTLDIAACKHLTRRACRVQARTHAHVVWSARKHEYTQHAPSMLTIRRTGSIPVLSAHTWKRSCGNR
ncbi:uncharacterized protein LOC144736636 isoform X1 [Lampetra planeri]